MKFEQFRDGQRGIANDWAIKITKVGRRYEVKVLEETDVVVENVEFGDDPVVNMDLENFIAMHTNNNFVDFKNKGWSTLKASDCTTEVLDNIANKLDKVYMLTKSDTKKLVWLYKLGEPRYMGYDQDKNTWEVDFIRVSLEDEENTDWKESSTD